MKILSEEVKSNQRSIFGFMKDRTNAREFQQFLVDYGPLSDSPFLTPDYLWNYFVEAPNDIGVKRDVVDIKNYYRSQVDRNRMMDEDDNRVFKTILIFELITRLGGRANKFFVPSVKNVVRSYQGSGLDPEPIIMKLEEMGCITITNGDSISILSQVIDREKIQAEINDGMAKFNETIRPDVEAFVGSQVNRVRVSTQERYGYFSSSVSKTTLSNFKKDKFDLKHGTICIWAVFAENLTESEDSDARIRNILEQTKEDFRIVMLDLSKTTFCLNDAKRWENYVECQVRSNSQDRSVRESMQSMMRGFISDWHSELEKSQFLMYYYDPDADQIEVHKLGFDRLEDHLFDFLRSSMPYCPDILTNNSNMLKSVRSDVIKLGFSPDQNPSREFSPFYNQIKTIVDWNPDWFDRHPDNLISVIHREIMGDMQKSFSVKRDYSLKDTLDRLRGGRFGLIPDNICGFILGFCMKELLDDGLILNTGKMTRELGINELSSLIRDSLSNTSAEAQYKIRSLSEEDRAFMANVPRMFKFPQTDDRNIKSVVNAVTEQFNIISGRVPIWVIPDYAEYMGDERAENIGSLIRNLSIICKTSSKGNSEEYSDAIRDAGILFMNDPDLAEHCSMYIDGVTLRNALTFYLDKNYPVLKETADQMGLLPIQYTVAVLNKMSASAGSLWEESNLAMNVDEVIAEYMIVEVFRDLLGGGSITYDDTISAIRKRIEADNRLPRVLITDVHPALTEFLDSLDDLDRQHDVHTLVKIRDISKQNKNIIRDLFFDLDLVETIAIIRRKAGDLYGLDDDEVRSVYSKMGSFYNRSESEFIDQFRNECQHFAQTQNRNRVRNLWSEKVSSQSPYDWMKENRMPSRFSMAGLDSKDVGDVIDCFYNPERLTSTVMESLLEKLGQWTYDYSRSKEAFMHWCIPTRYAGMNIQFSSVVEYLSRIDADPDKWDNESADGLIKEKYRTDFVPETKAKICDMNPEKLREILLNHLEDNPDLGLLFWEI